MLSLLAAFARPADREVVIRAAAHPEGAARLLAELERIGALLAPGTEAVETEPPSALITDVLAPVAVAVDNLAGTLAAIGPEIAAAIQAETGLGLRGRLMAVVGGIAGIQAEIGARLPGWISAQLARLELPERGLSIHVGAGSARLEGWVNLDAWPAELSLDIRWGLPFADGAADRVYLSHVLEHLSYPNDALQLMGEIRRVLAPGGRVRIVVPDIEQCIQAYVDGDRRFFEGRKANWPEWQIRTRLESFLGYAGVGPFPSSFADSHKFGCDFETVGQLLEDAGFERVVRSAYQDSDDPALRVDEASAFALAQVDGRYYSLFVEARAAAPGPAAEIERRRPGAV